MQPGHPACCDAEYELVFIDNGSSDHTPELIKNYPLHRNSNFRKLKYRRFQENRGVAAAINAGVKFSAGSLILQADNDVVFGPKSLSTLCAWMGKYPGALVSPNWPWIQRKLGTRYFTSAAGMTPDALAAWAEKGMQAPLEKNRATGSCWICSKKLFLKVKGWDRGL